MSGGPTALDGGSLRLSTSPRGPKYLFPFLPPSSAWGTAGTFWAGTHTGLGSPSPAERSLPQALACALAALPLLRELSLCFGSEVKRFPGLCLDPG